MKKKRERKEEKVFLVDKNAGTQEIRVKKEREGTSPYFCNQKRRREKGPVNIIN